MSCAKFETDIALHAGGDLPANRVAPVETHLHGCAECRAMADDLRAGRALLSERCDSPLEDAMLAEVRRRVLAEVGATRRQPFRVSGKLALAAALILAAILAWPRHNARRALPVQVAHVDTPPAIPVTPVPRAKIIPVRQRAGRRRARGREAQAGPPLLVQFVTDDPNIVIYWLVDQKPQGD